MCYENRSFLKTLLGGVEYHALYDPGATVSLVNAKIAEKFKNRLKKAETLIETATGTTSRILGELKLFLVVDNAPGELKFKAESNIKHDIILGIDFVRNWDIETRKGQTEWRVGEAAILDAPWHTFNESRSTGIGVLAEYAGISELELNEREKLEKLVDEILATADDKVGNTTLVEHETVVKPGTKPVRQAPQRMSEKISEFAREEVKRMLADDVIEPSKSYWCSRQVIVKKANGNYRFRRLSRFE